MVAGQALPATRSFNVPGMDALGAMLDTLQHPINSFVHVRIPVLGVAAIPIFAVLHSAIVAVWFFGAPDGDAMRSRPLWQRFVGYNLVAFGGSVITGTFFVDVASDEKGLLMGRPAAVLLTNSWVPTYWIMFALFNLPNSPLLETLSPQTYRSIPGVSIAMGLAISVIDAMSRTFAISGTIEGIRNSPYPHIHVLSDSLLAMFVLGGVAAMGGGLLDGVFGLRKREWSVRTPSFLVQARDGWAFRWCAACSGIYLLLTDVNLARYVASVFETLHLAPMAYLIAPKSMLVKDSTKWVAPFLPSEAKVVICAVLIGAIAWRNVLEGIVSPPVKLSTSTQPAKSASLTPSKKTK